MTSLPLHEPLLIAINNRIRLSHCNNIDVLASFGPHTTQLLVTGTSSFWPLWHVVAIMGAFSLKPRIFNTTPQPSAPEASVWIVIVIEC